MNTTKFFRSFPQILFVAITLLVLVFGQVSPAAAQSSNPPAVASYDQLPVKGQLIVPAGKGWVAPEQWHNLNVTIWYGVKEDTVATMANLGNGLAEDRVRNYGGVKSDYPTVVWSGVSVAITGNNCRKEFYSDATILTAGVVYGDQCPLLIEYNAEKQPAILAAPTQAPSLTLTPTVAPTSTPTSQPEVTPTPTIIPEGTPIAACEWKNPPQVDGYKAEPGSNCQWNLIPLENSERTAEDVLLEQVEFAEWQANFYFWSLIGVLLVALATVIFFAFRRRPVAHKKVEEKEE